MNQFEKMYLSLVNTSGDINEHLPVLKKYAEKCETIIEMGVRWVVSTYAFAITKPKKFASIDIYHPHHWGDNASKRLDEIIAYSKENNFEYNFFEADTLLLDIQETDLLFIDTLHRYGQLKAELKRHGNKAKKYLIFHDTTLYEYADEGINPSDDKLLKTKSTLDESKQGLWPAIEEFLQENPHWVLHERYFNNNGLTILKRTNT